MSSFLRREPAANMLFTVFFIVIDYSPSQHGIVQVRKLLNSRRCTLGSNNRERLIKKSGPDKPVVPVFCSGTTVLLVVQINATGFFKENKLLQERRLRTKLDNFPR